MLFRCRSHHLYLTESRSPLKLRSIWAHYSQRFVLLVSHGISLSLHPPLAAVKFDSATGSGRSYFSHWRRSDSITLFKIGVIHRKKLGSLVFHGISSSLHPPLAVVALNDSVQNRRDSSQKARITSFSRNFVLPSSATGSGRTQFILD